MAEQNHIRYNMSSFTAPSNYAYPNVRVMAMKGFLLKDMDIKALISSRDLEGYVALLEHTRYMENFSKLERIRIDDIEKALFVHLVNTNKIIQDMLPDKAAKFFAERSRKYEIELLKILINRSERTNLDYSSYYPLLSRDIKRVITQIIESKDITDVVELLSKTEYGRFLEGVPVSGEQRLSFITALDRYYLESLWSNIGGLPKIDGRVGRTIVGTEIDIINIMTILRAIKGNYDAEKFIIPVSYRLGDVRGISGIGNISDFVSKLSNTVYGDILEKSLPKYEETNSLLSFELNLKNYLLQKSKELFAGYPFHIGIPLGFLIIKEMEVENLRAIAIGIDSGLPSNEIEGMIAR